MKHLIIICAGIAWTGIAVILHFFFGLTLPDLPDILPKFAASGVVTSYAVTYLFRSYLIMPAAQKNFWLPLATISCGVSIWCLLLFTLSAVQSTLGERSDLFDGFWYFIILAVAISLTIALPITYPAAFLTQKLISRCGKANHA